MEIFIILLLVAILFIAIITLRAVLALGDETIDTVLADPGFSDARKNAEAVHKAVKKKATTKRR